MNPAEGSAKQAASVACGQRDSGQVAASAVRCAHCRGTGTVNALACATCRGKGFVALPAMPLVSCPACCGSGDDASAPAVACLVCAGIGLVPDRREASNLPAPR